MQLLPLSVLVLACTARAAIINYKQHKCSPPESAQKLKPVLLGDLPSRTVLQIKDPVSDGFSTTINRTLILDRFFSDELTTLNVIMQKLSDRVAIVTVKCEPLKMQIFCSHFMLVQSATSHALWIKQVIPGELIFYGFQHGWRTAFLQRESTSSVSFVLKVCHFSQMRLISELNHSATFHSRLRCAPFDKGGLKRTASCGTVNRIFSQLARRISKGQITYPGEIARLFVLKLTAAVGCVIGYFLGISSLLKKFIK